MYVPHPDIAIFLAALTARERQIAAYIADGQSNKVIAIDLGISLRTVEAHRARIFTKLKARNAMQLACRLCAHGHPDVSVPRGTQVSCAGEASSEGAAYLPPPYPPLAAMAGYTVGKAPVAAIVADSSVALRSKGVWSK